MVRTLQNQLHCNLSNSHQKWLMKPSLRSEQSLIKAHKVRKRRDTLYMKESLFLPSKRSYEQQKTNQCSYRSTGWFRPVPGPPLSAQKMEGIASQRHSVGHWQHVQTACTTKRQKIESDVIIATEMLSIRRRRWEFLSWREALLMHISLDSQTQISIATTTFRQRKT